MWITGVEAGRVLAAVAERPPDRVAGLVKAVTHERELRDGGDLTRLAGLLRRVCRGQPSSFGSGDRAWKGGNGEEGGLTAGVAFEPVDFVLAEPERVVRLVPELPRRAAAVQRAAIAVCSAASRRQDPPREGGAGKRGRGWGRTEAELEAEGVDV